MKTSYKERMRVEYQELVYRVNKLESMLDTYQKGGLDFVPTCPISLLYEQLDVMKHYRAILEERASMEDVALGN